MLQIPSKNQAIPLKIRIIRDGKIKRRQSAYFYSSAILGFYQEQNNLNVFHRRICQGSFICLQRIIDLNDKARPRGARAAAIPEQQPDDGSDDGT